MQAALNLFSIIYRMAFCSKIIYNIYIPAIRKDVFMPKGVFNIALFKIFMILMVIISVMFASNYYIYKSSMDAMFEQAEANNRLVVKGIIQSFEESFREINDMIYTVGTLPYRVYDSEGYSNINMNSAFLLMRNVRQLISQDYIYDFIIFYKNSDLVLTLEGTESFNSIFSKKYKSGKYAPEFWKNFSVTSHPMKIIPSGYYGNSGGSSGKNLLAIVASNQMSGSVQNIVVFVDLPKLYNEVNKQSMMRGTALIILDRDKNVIVSTDEDYKIDGLESIFFDSGNETVFQKGKYNYYCTRSEYNSFIYINKVPYRYEGAIPTVKVNRMILLLTTAAGIFISLLLSMYIYSPVRKLVGLVGVKDGEKRQNHYKHIYNSIEKMQQENKLISNKMDGVKEEVMRSIFFKMIDDITFYKDMKDQIDTYFKAVFSGKQFFMAAFDLESGPGAFKTLQDGALLTQPDEVTAKIRQAMDQIEHTSAVVFYLENMQFITIAGIDGQVRRDAMLKNIGAVKEQLQSAFPDYIVFAAASRFYTDVKDCKEAFEDIRMCFTYRDVKHTNTLIDLEKNEFSYDIYMPLDFDEKLSNYILSGNTGESLRVIRQVINTNVENNISYIKFQYIINNIFNTLVSILVYLKADREEIRGNEKEFRRLADSYGHCEEITGFFEDMVGKMAEKVRVGNSGKLNKDFVLQYIHLHYAENLYLDKMAEIFNTTPKYFSNFFKKAFGINFVEYLNKVRMSHAKELLKNSDIPVGEIGGKVGYLASSTFASTFRKYCGITPSEFRKEYGKKPAART